jgi:nuclear GTP-binding protein
MNLTSESSSQTQNSFNASHSLQKKIMKYHRRIRRQISRLSKEGHLSRKSSINLKKRFLTNKNKDKSMSLRELANGAQLRSQVARTMIRRLSFSETDSTDFIKNLRTEDFGLTKENAFAFDESDSSNQVSECDENFLSHQFPESASSYQTSKSSFLRQKIQSKKWKVDDRTVTKVIKRARSWDVVVQVVDARDPQGTQIKGLRNLLHKQGFSGQMCLILNKVDLVPDNIVNQWKGHLSNEFKVFTSGKDKDNLENKEKENQSDLFEYLRNMQRATLEEKLKNKLKVGFLGLPNSGKSTIINRLFGRKVCGVSPKPGHTRAIIEKYLTRTIILSDVPGIFHDNFAEMLNPEIQNRELPIKPASGIFEKVDLNSSSMNNPFSSATGTLEDPEIGRTLSLVLNNAISLEHISDLLAPVEFILNFLTKEFFESFYQIEKFESTEHFLRKLALQKNIFSVNGQIDIRLVARYVICQWNRGQIPHYTTPSITISNSEYY